MKLGDRSALPLPSRLLLHGHTLSPRDIGFKVEVKPLFLGTWLLHCLNKPNV